MFRPLRVTFHLDGAGVLYDPHEPTHLDGLLAFAVAHRFTTGEAPGRDDPPDHISLPMARWQCPSLGVWGWQASALFPDGQTAESVQFWRKKFRQNRLELTNGSPNLTNATYREWNMPMPLTLCHRMVGWCVGERGDIRRDLLRGVRHLGRKPSMGKGVVNDVTVEVAEDEPWALVRDGCAQRWLPDTNGVRQVRPRPPYWNNVSRMRSCEIGDPYDVAHLSL